METEKERRMRFCMGRFSWAGIGRVGRVGREVEMAKYQTMHLMKRRNNFRLREVRW